ncbi:MAG: phosphoribosyltransferase [Nitrospirae bacterium]|nr:phosphoribosyltransferase [Nitrospirota bacterium]
MESLIEDRGLRDRQFVFEDRDDAGERLASALESYRGTNALVLAIPSGGVPIGAKIAQQLALPFDLLIVRKLQIPFNTEAGFGAMTLDGEVILNKELVGSLGLGKDAINATIHATKEILERRNKLFRKSRPMPDCRGKTVIITDDGLASGYTMRAAVQTVRGMRPLKIVVAVPTSSEWTVAAIRREIDELVCLNIRGGQRFAVAEAYRNWYDLSDEEVLRTVAE